MTDQKEEANPIQPTELESEGKPILLRNIPKYFRPPVTSRELGKMAAVDLGDAAYKIQGWISDYCGYLAELLYFDPKLQENLFARLQEARKNIETSTRADALENSNNLTGTKRSSDLEVVLNAAIFEVHRVHASIATEQELVKKRGSLGNIFTVLSFA